ncbi:MAG: acetylglutamate kinase [Phycisphaerales bacterium]|nr:acetylglutamate kinase [Phycisphaerales bacterium]
MSEPRPMVVKIGGAALDDAARASELWRALAETHAATGGRLIVVHGGGRAVDEHLARLGMVSERREGIRITPREQIDEIVGVLAGRVNKAVVGALHAAGVPAVGLCLGDGGISRTARATGYSFDPGFVGEIRGGDPRLLTLLIGAGFPPVVSSIGLDEQGRPLNVNADDAAAGLARIVGASRLVLMTDVPGILGADRRLIARLTPREVEGLIDRGVVSGGMIPKARAAARAAEASGSPCTICSWNAPGDLIRLARGEPAGTSVVPG